MSTSNEFINIPPDTSSGSSGGGGGGGGGGGTGTVTSVSVASANGLAGTVASPTTTPSITLSTTVTGILYGNGTSISSASASQFPTLNQNTTGTAQTIIGNLSASQITGILPSANGGTNNGFTAFSGPTTSTKTFVLPNASDTIATLGVVNAFTKQTYVAAAA